MPEMICSGCGGSGMKQEQKLSQVTNPDGSTVMHTETVIVTCTSCGGSGKQSY